MIFVECDPDKYVVKKIVPKTRIIHGGGKTGVLNALEGERRAVGIVDADPHFRKPPGDMRKGYVREDVKDTIELMRKKGDEGKFLIVLSPDIEGWLVNKAKQNGISLRDYNLPDDPERMHDITHIERDLNFQKFIKKLIQTSDDEINVLRRWIKEAIA